MGFPSVKKYLPGKDPIEKWKKLTPQAFIPYLLYFNARPCNFNRGLPCNLPNNLGLLLIISISAVLAEPVQDINSSILANNSTVAAGQKLSSSRSDIFYNATYDGLNKHDHYNNSNVCLKEHKIKERDVKEEKNLGTKKGKVKIYEKDSFGSVGDEEDEDFAFEFSGEAYEGMNECNSCARDKIRVKFLETIKDSILSKLGMSQPPNVTNRPKPKIADHLLMMLLKKRHSHHGSNGLYWIQDDDSEEMQGDEPYDSHYSDKPSGKNNDFTNKNNFVRSQGNTSDKYTESNEFQEGEVLMEEDDDYHVRTERIVAFSQPHPRIRHLPNIQYFEFSDRLRTSKIKRALLWIYIKGRESTSVVGNKITISIYKIIDPGKPGLSTRESPVITSVKADSTQFIPSGSGAWITMEYIQIKNLVAEWFRYPQHNLGIVIIAEDANRTNLAVTANSGNDTALVPFLEVYVTDNRKHRTKRTVGLNCKDSSKETRCCRYPLLVDFLEFGWDWIIAPKKYEAFYCAGECPLAFLPQHPHTHIAQLSNIPGSNGACCAPRKLSELDMLYFDQDMNIIFGKVPAMRVDRCGCT